MFKLNIFIFIIFCGLNLTAQDVFERKLVFPEGTPYEGQELDLTSTRNLQELTPSLIQDFFKESPSSDYYYVANFRHKSKYWVAKIPLNSVEKVIFQFQNLSTLAKKGIPKPVLNWLRMGHIQTRFILKKGFYIQLITQNNSLPREIDFIHDFSYALNAVRAKSEKGSSFDPIGDGMNAGYGLSHTFISTYDTAMFFKDQDLNVEQYELQLHPKNQNEHLIRASILLKFHIQKSISSIETEEYNTLRDSCVTNTMEGLYSVAKNRPVIWWFRVWRNWRWYTQTFGSGFEYNPRAVVALLKKQDYILQRLLNLEIEFKSLIEGF